MPRPVLTIKEPYTPEMIGEAVELVEGLLHEDMDVFEYGSGYSTVWLAQRVKRVVFVEHDRAWYEETDRALREVGRVSKTKGVYVEDENDIAGAIEHYGEFDLILVDCLDRQRVSAVAEAVDHVKPGGYLVLDDSQWNMLQPARQALEALGWNAVTHNGQHRRKNGDVRYHQTTIYQRPPLEQGADEEE